MEPTSIILISIIAFIVAIIASMVGSAGLIMTPILIFFGLPIQTAIGTNWVADAFMCLTSTIRYHKDKHIKFKKILSFSIIAALAGAIGIRLLLKINEQLLSKIISAIIILMALFFIVKNNLGLEKKHKKQNMLLIAVTAIILGIYGGFFGGGLGSLLIVALILLYGFDFITATANSKIIELIMAIVIVTGFIIAGLVDKQVVIPYTIASALGGWYGAKTATRIGNKWLKIIFITAAVIVGIKLWVG